VTGKTDSATLDQAIQMYLAGKSVKEIEAACGIHSVTLTRERNRRGIPSRKVKQIPVAEAVKLYLSGMSASELGRRYGVARDTVRLRLVAAGIGIRPADEATSLWMSQESEESKTIRAEAAAEACRTTEYRERVSRRFAGITKDPDVLERRAQNRERRAIADPMYAYISDHERQFRRLLEEAGENPIPQKAIGRYNVDLAIGPVAVEILGGHWHSIKRQHSIRTPYILNRGWHLIMVWSMFHDGTDWVYMSPAAAEYVVAFAQEARRNPPMVGEYRVIRSDGQLLAAGGSEDDELAFIPPTRPRLRPGA
jgi:very-short-patch-repair endonuclease